MVSEGYLGLALTLCLVLACAVLVEQSRINRRLKLIIIAALLLRLVGSFTYYGVIQRVYGGGDYVFYYDHALEYANRIGRGDFSMFTNSSEWFGRTWWGTQFVFFPTGIIIALLGSNILTGFVVFSLLGFLGLIGFAIAFRRSFPHVPVQRYLVWIWLFPSLWFWSAAIGKDAVLLCGLGLATCGFVGRNGRIRWPLLCIGIFLVFAIRPQVAAVATFAIVLGQWWASSKRWTVKNAVQSFVILIAATVVMHYGITAIGAGGVGDVEGVGEYMGFRAAHAAIGGTNTEQSTVVWLALPMALVNILFRPFPFESTSVTAVFAGFELWAMWVIAYRKRKNIVNAIRNCRSSRLLSFAIAFILLYSVTLGMVVVNLGIIARQRIFLFPFIFLLFEAKPAPAKTRRCVTRRRERQSAAGVMPGVQ